MSQQLRMIKQGPKILRINYSKKYYALIIYDHSLQFIQQYDDEDLMEIVLPRLAKVMTVWEFVLMKVMNSYTLHLDLLN